MIVCSATGTALGCQVHDPRLASSYDDVAFDAAASDDEAANQDVVMAEADADAPPAPAAGAQAVAPDGLQLWDELKAARPPHSEGQVLPAGGMSRNAPVRQKLRSCLLTEHQAIVGTLLGPSCLSVC